MRHVRLPTLLALALPIALVACGKKGGDGKSAGGEKVHQVPALGVQVTAPSDWSVKQHGSRWAVRSVMKGVTLGKALGSMPKSPEEAAKQFADSKILEKAALPSGAIYVHYEMKFPTGMGKPPMWLKFVYVILPTPGGAVTCQVQLQSDSEKPLYEQVCKSLALAKGGTK